MNTKMLPRIIYPLPVKTNWEDGILSLKDNIELFLPENIDNSFKELVTEIWPGFSFGRLELQLKTDNTLPQNSFLLVVNNKPMIPILDETSTYAVCVNANGIAALAVDEISLKHAWFTVLQMLQAETSTPEVESFNVPYVQIQDHPKMNFRAIHICVFPETSLEFLEKIIKLTAFLKYSHMVIEFWGMLKFDVLSELSWPQAYSKEQIRPLLELARRMGLQPIPMFNHWGHAAASRASFARHVVLDQNPALASLFEIDGWTWCLTNPESMRILQQIRAELLELFGNIEYFHLGCDESYSHAMCDNCRKHDSPTLWADFLNSINAELKQRNIRPMMWGDALLEPDKWEGYTALSRADQRTHEALELLDRDFIISDWQYECEIPSNESATIKHFIKNGFDVVSAPWYDYKNIQTLAEGAIKNNAMGMLFTTWHTLPIRMPSIVFASVMAWGKEDGFNDFSQYDQMQRSICGSLCRKLHGKASDYKNAGWRTFEVCESV
jgi:Glycosyl hydrolase family 20, catalytic domain